MFISQVKQRVIPSERTGQLTVSRQHLSLLAISPITVHSLVGCVTDGATRVSHVIYQDGHPILHVSHEHHAIHLVGLLPLFVNQGKVDIQPVCNGGHSVKQGVSHFNVCQGRCKGGVLVLHSTLRDRSSQYPIEYVPQALTERSWRPPSEAMIRRQKC